jgi:hypothetical protein
VVKGWKISGQERFARAPDKLNYHMADRGGRMYWCDCARCLRIGNRVKMAWTLKGQDAGKLALKRGR